jgi:hypothetical protein
VKRCRPHRLGAGEANTRGGKKAGRAPAPRRGKEGGGRGGRGAQFCLGARVIRGLEVSSRVGFGSAPAGAPLPDSPLGGLASLTCGAETDAGRSGAGQSAAWGGAWWSVWWVLLDFLLLAGRAGRGWCIQYWCRGLPSQGGSASAAWRGHVSVADCAFLSHSASWVKKKMGAGAGASERFKGHPPPPRRLTFVFALNSQLYWKEL